MKYIQCKSGKDLITVDQFETIKEAQAVLIEYRIADPYATYYISNRACKNW